MTTPETSRPKSALQVNGLQNGESCRSCLYTGVATSVGLSGYFLYLAMEEELHRTTKQSESSPHKPHATNGEIKNAPVISRSNSSKKNTPTGFQSSFASFMRGNQGQVPKKNRPFLFAMSAFWCVAGAYRLYLNWFYLDWVCPCQWLWIIFNLNVHTRGKDLHNETLKCSGISCKANME